MIKVFIAGGLVAIAIILTFIQRIGVVKDLSFGAIRSFVQLIAVGYIIQFVFDLKGLLYQSLLLFLMVLIASYTARGRAKESPYAFLLSLISIFTGTFITLGVMLLMRIITTEPKFLIPLGGMIIGNTMNAVSIFLERFYNEFKEKKNLIEVFLSLGASPKEASKELVEKSVKTAMIPITNIMKIVGIIQLPGAMTGMILAGASPLEAAKIQIIVIYMLSASVAIAISLLALISYRFYFTPSALHL